MLSLVRGQSFNRNDGSGETSHPRWRHRWPPCCLDPRRAETSFILNVLRGRHRALALQAIANSVVKQVHVATVAAATNLGSPSQRRTLGGSCGFGNGPLDGPPPHRNNADRSLRDADLLVRREGHDRRGFLPESRHRLAECTHLALTRRGIRDRCTRLNQPRRCHEVDLVAALRT